jgi:DNA-binding HxlR family transcriptional regulator
MLSGPVGFGDIRRGIPRIPPATLASRLRTPRSAGLVEVSDPRYRLTGAGLGLAPIVRELARWAMTTESAALTEDDLDTASCRRRRTIGRPCPATRGVEVAIRISCRNSECRSPRTMDIDICDTEIVVL